MKIIAIEGLDKAGKATQSVLLAEHLKAQGFTVIQSEFHRYDTPTGKLIMDWLAGRWDVDQHTIELIIAADKQAQQKWFKKLEDNHTDFLVLDRYTSSQIVYSLSGGMDWHWIRALHANLRKPDFEIFIDIPAEESMSRKGKHNNGDNDRYESDFDLLVRVRDYFTQRAENWGVSHKIDGMKLVEEIHKDIKLAVAGLITQHTAPSVGLIEDIAKQ